MDLLIESIEEAEDNAIRFGEVTSHPELPVYSRLGQFSHWYYFPRSDVIAPSKFIGYRGTTVFSYTGKGITGTDTQTRLSKWFHKLERSSPLYAPLRNRLGSFLRTCGHNLSAKTIEGTGGIWLPQPRYFTVIYPDQITDEVYTEGSAKSVKVNAYERNPKARAACIRHYGSACYACGLDFKTIYGKRGIGFIHVHHLRELSSIGEQYVVDPVKDLRPLCPNCHAMVHMENPATCTDKLKSELSDWRAYTKGFQPT